MIEIIKHSWEDISINDYYMLIEALKNDNEAEAIIKIYAVLCNSDVETIKKMPYKDFQTITQIPVEWIYKPVTGKKKVKKCIKIHENEYLYNDKATKLTTAQFIDLQQIVSNNPNIEDLLAIILIPKGKKYGEYDIDDVKEEFKEYLDIETAKSLVNFLLASTNKSFRAILTYLSYLIKKMSKKETGKQKERLIEAQKQIKQLAQFSLGSI